MISLQLLAGVGSLASSLFSHVMPTGVGQVSAEDYTVVLMTVEHLFDTLGNAVLQDVDQV